MMSKQFFFKNLLWVVLTLVGILGFLSIYLFMPRQGAIDSAIKFSYKIFIYVIICFAVASIPNRFKMWHYFIIGGIVFLLLVLFTRVSFYGFVLIPSKGNEVIDGFYTLMYLIIFNFISLLIAFSYRAGGGSAGNTFKIAISGQIVMLSGLYDLSIYILNKVPFNETLTHAHHIKVFIGHFPTPKETLIFSLFHIPVLVFVLLAPIDKWLKKLKIEVE